MHGAVVRATAESGNASYSTSAVVLGLEQEEYTVCEGDGFVTVCLELISGQLASTVELSANLSTQDITAQGGNYR